MKRGFPCPLCTATQTLQTVDSHLETCIKIYQSQQDEYCSEYESEYESEEDEEEVIEASTN
jgi:hypothetical protein